MSVGGGVRCGLVVVLGFPLSAGIPRSHRYARSRPLTLREGGGRVTDPPLPGGAPSPLR